MLVVVACWKMGWSGESYFFDRMDWLAGALYRAAQIQVVLVGDIDRSV
jgi:predicted alpha-1,6-mannanase (GH76 family)